MSPFFSHGRGRERERERRQQARLRGTLTSRQYEILRLAVIQSWTHLALYGESGDGAEIFTRRITKFRAASPSRNSTYPRNNDAGQDRCGTGVKADIGYRRARGCDAKTLLPCIFLGALTRRLYSARSREGDPYAESIVSIPEFLIRLCRCSRRS